MPGERWNSVLGALFRLSLRLYSRDFRARYGPEAEAMFAESLEAQRGQGGMAALRALAAAVMDVFLTAPRERRAAAAGASSAAPGNPSRPDSLAAIVRDEVRGSVQTLARAKGFAAVATLTLALGIGSGVTVYIVADRVLFQPLPYAQASELVAVWPEHFFSSRDVIALREHAGPFVDLASVSPGWTMPLTGQGDPVKVRAALVSRNFFDLLGVGAVSGRTFADSDEEAVAVLAHQLWIARFGGDADVVGRTVELNGELVTVIGVMPSRFEPIHAGTDLWMPMSMNPRDWRYTSEASVLLARLSDGGSAQSVRAELGAMLAGLRAAFSYADDYGRGAEVVPLLDYMIGGYSGMILALLGAVGCMATLAAISVGNLVVARAVHRGRELAVRIALGAGRSRIAGQLILEHTFLALAASAAGLALAGAMLPLVASRLPAGLPRMEQLAVGPDVAVGTSVAAVVLGVALGTAAALAGMRGGASAALGGLARTISAPRTVRVRKALLAGQLALTVILTGGAALMAETLRRLAAVELGFREDRVLTLTLQPTRAAYPGDDALLSFHRDVVARLGAIPGVEAVGAIQHLPLSGIGWTGPVAIEGDEPRPGTEPPRAGSRAVAGDYFGAMGIPILEGRGFEPSDDHGGRPVAVVNRAFARAHWPAESALGKHFRLGPSELTVVGVAGDVRHSAVTEPALPEVYQPIAQFTLPFLTFVLRTRTAEPAALADAAREAVRQVDPTVPVTDVRPLAEVVARSVNRQRLMGTLLGSFSVLGTLLAVVAVYGLVSYLLRQRRRELGLRLALGAEPRRLLAFAMGEGLALALVGVTIGIVGALLLGRILASFLFQVSPTSAPALGAAALGVLCATALATLGPALRAARTRPAEALRD
jgi:putative ABC transport system permease protein